MKIRVKFEKQGDLKFIGHLDVMRYFQKLNRRAKLDIAYSHGYSPHQEMSFATPLGLGITSSSEYVDIEFVTAPGREELIRRMNAVNVPELRIVDASLLPEKSKTAMAMMAAADYTIRFREGYGPADTDGFFREFMDFMNRPEILAEKETKTGKNIKNIRPEVREARREGNALFLKVDAGSKSNLRPELLLKAFFREKGEELPDIALLVNREEMYGEDENGNLKSLLAFGTDF